MLKKKELKLLPGSAKEARQGGSKYYYNGNACPQGHVVERATSSQGCVQCMRERRKTSRIENPEKEKKYNENQKIRMRDLYKNSEDHRNKVRNDSFQRHYGLSIGEYKALVKKQKGKCQVCGIHESELKKRLAVDHCHKTKEIRGLLCQNCNFMLGHFKDDPLLLNSAAKYLKADVDYRRHDRVSKTSHD